MEQRLAKVNPKWCFAGPLQPLREQAAGIAEDAGAAQKKGRQSCFTLCFFRALSWLVAFPRFCGL